MLLARGFVEGKIRNQRTLLRRQLGTLAATELQQLSLLVDRVRKALSPDVLLGLEGQAARVYFSRFADMLKVGTPFDFEHRNRRPPRDPVNALLSFLYSMLVRECVAGLLSVGLEPELGFLHRLRAGRPGLALDLAEEFRPIIADSVVLSLVNTGEVETSPLRIAARRGGAHDRRPASRDSRIRAADKYHGNPPRFWIRHILSPRNCGASTSASTCPRRRYPALSGLCDALMAQRVYLLSYDIREKRRLRPMHKVATAFGRRLQYSLYACALTRAQRIDLRIAVGGVIDAAVDSVIILDLGAIADRESWMPPYESLGAVLALEARSSIIV